MPESAPIVLATRKSPLAVRQAELTAAFLKEKWPQARFELLKLSTTGDARKAWSLEERGGKGLFTKELEDALLGGRATCAVHSSKDLPTELPPGLALAGFLPREDPTDVLILREGVDVPAMLATSSPRRRAQLKSFFPNAVWCEIRGSVETRLKKVAGGHCDGTMLAAAGLKRLGIESFPGTVFKPFKSRVFIPAAGQGAIGIECREADVEKFRAALDGGTALAVETERRFLDRLGGGCHTAIAVHYDLASCDLGVYHEETGRQHFDLPADLAAHPSELDARLAEIQEKLFKA